jgi:hypothetical protein
VIDLRIYGTDDLEIDVAIDLVIDLMISRSAGRLDVRRDFQ